jgi:hypothetical protein
LGSAAYLIGGSVLAIASLLLAPLPGPGMLTVLLGLGMVAGEFRPGARLLDRGEVRARRLARWVGASGGRPPRGRPWSSWVSIDDALPRYEKNPPLGG